jgi:hypothetical protein
VIIPAKKATGPLRELLDAAAQLQDASLAYTAAQARYRAALDQVQAQDRDNTRS